MEDGNHLTTGNQQTTANEILSYPPTYAGGRQKTDVIVCMKWISLERYLFAIGLWSEYRHGGVSCSDSLVASSVCAKETTLDFSHISNLGVNESICGSRSHSTHMVYT